MIPEKRGEILQIFDRFYWCLEAVLIGEQAVVFC